MAFAQKLLIDADPGIGDAVALALALFDPGLDVVGVTATAGCVAGRDATRNLQVILENLDPPRLPRVGTSHAPLPCVEDSALPGVFNPAVLNGRSGLGDCLFRVAELHHEHDAAKLMIDIVRTYPHEVTLLTFGPLTNVERAMERAPEFLRLLKALVCCGGSLAVGGDVTAAAEFNIFADPEAARTVLRSAATKTLVPLDVSRKVVLNLPQLKQLTSSRPTRLTRFLGQILPFAFKAHHEHLGVEGVRLQEVAALAAVAHPECFEHRTLAVDVETQGELTRGMTVFDRRGLERWQTNIDVLTGVDVQGVLDYFSRIAGDAAAVE